MSEKSNKTGAIVGLAVFLGPLIVGPVVLMFFPGAGFALFALTLCVWMIAGMCVEGVDNSDHWM